MRYKLRWILLLLFLTVSVDASPYMFVDTIRQEYHQMKLLLDGQGYNAGAHNLGDLSGDGNSQGGAQIWVLDVAQGVIVDSAFIDFVAFGNTAGATVNVQFRVEDVVDADTLRTDGSSADKWTDFNSRTFWGTEVAWNDLEDWTSITSYRSPDIKVLIQHIVDQGSWVSGNKIHIPVGDFAGTSTTDVIRVYRAFQAYPTQAPILTVYYSPKGCDVTETYKDTVSAGPDDAGYWRYSGGCNWANDRTTIIFGNDFNDPANCAMRGGFRFQGLPFDPGTVFCSVILSVEAAITQSDIVKTIWHCEDTPDATAWDSDDWSSRIQTTASVEWDMPAFTSGIRYELDVTSIAQEVIDRGDWSNGNDLMFLYEDNGTAIGADRKRVIRSFDGSATEAAWLTITYAVDAPDFSTDTVYIFEDTTGNCPAGEICYEWLSEAIADEGTDLQAVATNKAIVFLIDGPWVSQSWNGTDSVWDTLVIIDSAVWNQDSTHSIVIKAINEAAANGVLDTVGEGPYTIGNSDLSEAKGVLQIKGGWVTVENIQILQRNSPTAVSDTLIKLFGVHHVVINACNIQDPNRDNAETHIGIWAFGDLTGLTIKNNMFMGFNAPNDDTCTAIFFTNSACDSVGILDNSFNNNDVDIKFAANLPDGMLITIAGNIHKSCDRAGIEFIGSGADTASIADGHIFNMVTSTDSSNVSLPSFIVPYQYEGFGTITSALFDNNLWPFYNLKNNEMSVTQGAAGIIDLGVDLSTQGGSRYGTVTRDSRGTLRHPTTPEVGYHEIATGFILISF